MYAPPPPTNARRNGIAAGGPVLAICCLLFILFLIAATIVLALIPVYVEKDITASKTTTTKAFVMTPDGNGKRQLLSNILCEGDLVAPTMTNFQNAINKALAFPDGTTIITTARNTAQSPTRRRRGYGLLGKRADGTKTYALFKLDKTRCSRCGSTSFLNGIAPFRITTTIFYSGNACPSQTVTYTVTISVTETVLPPLSATTTTTVSPTSSFG